VVIDLASDAGRAELGNCRAFACAGHQPAAVAIKKLGLTYSKLRRWKRANRLCGADRLRPGRAVCRKPGLRLRDPGADRCDGAHGRPFRAADQSRLFAVDNSAGLVAAMGLLAKIVEGKGGQVDVACTT